MLTARNLRFTWPIRHRRQPGARGQRGASTYPSVTTKPTFSWLFRIRPFLYGAVSVSRTGWLTDDAQRQDHDLWGGVSGYKTKYDPCPEGWKVPVAGAPWGFRSEYRKTGGLQDDGAYDATAPWYCDYVNDNGFRYKQADSGKEYWFPFTGKKDVVTGVLNGVGSGANYHTATRQNTLAIMELFAWGNPTQRDGSQPSLRFFGSLHQG